MASIIMCQNKICIFKKDCYRYNAIPSKDQPYMKFDMKEEELECDYYHYIPTFDIFDMTSYNERKKQDGK